MLMCPRVMYANGNLQSYGIKLKTILILVYQSKSKEYLLHYVVQVWFVHLFINILSKIPKFIRMHTYGCYLSKNCNQIIAIISELLRVNSLLFMSTQY